MYVSNHGSELIAAAVVIDVYGETIAVSIVEAFSRVYIVR